MKARILSLVAVVLLSVAGAYASSPKTKVYSNIDNQTKEYTFVDSETNKAVKKVIYNYDTNGILQERAYYNWDEFQGWVSTQKYSYEYSNDKLDTVVYTEWNKDMTATQHIIYTYNTDGEFLSAKQVKADNLMAAK
ncbi:MAG: hypothetical protein ACK5KL_04120 [Dysgonomonas sp.]|jgi:hypothetical protein|nr:hypothetical protein [Prevotella sp.]